MSEALVPSLNLPQSKYANDEVFNDLSGPGYLPRLQLFSSSNKQVKHGLINQGHFAIVKGQKDLIDLGKSVSCLVLGYRPKAIYMAPTGDINIYYNPKDPSFKDVQKKAENKDSSAMVGPEFLFCLPEHGRKFVLFFCSNKTLRSRSPLIKAEMGKGITMTSELVEWKSYAWHAPKIEACELLSGIPENEEEFQLFQAEIQRQLDTFNNPPESVVEAEEIDDPDDDREM